MSESKSQEQKARNIFISDKHLPIAIITESNGRVYVEADVPHNKRFLEIKIEDDHIVINSDYPISISPRAANEVWIRTG